MLLADWFRWRICIFLFLLLCCVIYYFFPSSRSYRKYRYHRTIIGHLLPMFWLWHWAKRKLDFGDNPLLPGLQIITNSDYNQFLCDDNRLKDHNMIFIGFYSVLNFLFCITDYHQLHLYYNTNIILIVLFFVQSSNWFSSSSSLNCHNCQEVDVISSQP